MSYLHIETQSLHGNSDHHALTASLVRSAPVKHWDGDFLLMLLQRKHQEHTKTHGCKYNPFTIITAPNFSVSTSSRDAELRGSSSFNRAASPCHCNCPQRPPPHPGRKYQLYRYTPMEDLQVDMIYVFFPFRRGKLSACLPGFSEQLHIAISLDRKSLNESCCYRTTQLQAPPSVHLNTQVLIAKSLQGVTFSKRTKHTKCQTSITSIPNPRCLEFIQYIMDASSFNFDVREYRIYQDDTLESPAAAHTTQL